LRAAPEGKLSYGPPKNPYRMVSHHLELI